MSKIVLAPAILFASAGALLCAAEVPLPVTATAEVLMLEKGPPAGAVTLHWAGGTSPWEIFRSIDPGMVVAPSNRLAETSATSWTDAPPADQHLVVYQVNSCGTPAAPEPHGCATCDICDTWGLTWAAVACTDHYLVLWKCIFFPEQVWNVGNATSVGDICSDIGMCDRCSSGVEYIHVEACSGSGCSSAAAVPTSETPSQCGGGCCVPR